MPVSLRLDRETELILEKIARTLGESKSQVIKLSIRDYCTGPWSKGSAGLMI